ncbi:MAG TPA: hypothetical protein VNI01_13930 [Elusimicrobiota bacterium]|nr:hypothetical protein [Elusimicrobiota bacterium]
MGFARGFVAACLLASPAFAAPRAVAPVPASAGLSLPVGPVSLQAPAAALNAGLENPLSAALPTETPLPTIAAPAAAPEPSLAIAEINPTFTPVTEPAPAPPLRRGGEAPPKNPGAKDEAPGATRIGASFQRLDAQSRPVQRMVASGDTSGARASSGEIFGEYGKWSVAEREEAREEASVLVATARRERRAVQIQRAELPPLDYRSSSFNEDAAREFSKKRFRFGDKTWSGRKILLMLLTPNAVVADLAVDPTRMDLATFGKSESSIWELARARRIPIHAIDDALKEAFRMGLVYRVHDRIAGRSYYGVPYPTRSALRLRSFRRAASLAVAASQRAAPRQQAPWAEDLLQLAAQVADLPAKDETFELVAQAVLAAEKSGDIEAAKVPAGFQAKAEAIGFEVPPLSSALETLHDLLAGTPYEGAWENMARHGAGALLAI